MAASRHHVFWMLFCNPCFGASAHRKSGICTPLGPQHISPPHGLPKCDSGLPLVLISAPFPESNFASIFRPLFVLIFAPRGAPFESFEMMKSISLGKRGIIKKQLVLLAFPHWRGIREPPGGRPEMRRETERRREANREPKGIPKGPTL